MIRILIIAVFMIPLRFIARGFWIHQLRYFVIRFLIILDYRGQSWFRSVRYFRGKDVLRYMIVLLSVWICCLIVTASVKVKISNSYPGLFLLVVLILLISLYVAFASMNLLLFYIFFEMSLIPTLHLILGWGYQTERLQAGVYLLFYTLFGSLPMIIRIFYLYRVSGSIDYFYFIPVDSLLFFLCINFAFIVKIPMYFVHLWLPEAHVEAPVSGSMILAGIMLKLGGYGLIRLLSVRAPVISKINHYIISVSLVGDLVVSFICLYQPDIKSLIAYSSVSHIGLVLGGLMTLSYWGVYGGLVIIIAHGLCSSGLFCLANIRYERFLSRRA